MEQVATVERAPMAIVAVESAVSVASVVSVAPEASVVRMAVPADAAGMAAWVAAMVRAVRLAV